MMAENMMEGMEIPKPYQNLIQVIGWEATVQLCQVYGGEAMYIPKPDRLEAAKRRYLIRKEWNGHNTIELAKKYGHSVRSIQHIVEDARQTEDRK